MKLLELYFQFSNNIKGLFINNDILYCINLIDEIGCENVLKKYIYNRINQKIIQNQIYFDFNLDQLKLEITPDKISTFILENISFITINKLGLYGYICINKYDEMINKIISNNTSNKILIIYITKIYSEFLIEQIKEYLKIYLQLINLELDLDYDNFNEKFNENMIKLFDYLKINNKNNIDNIKNANQTYDNDINTLNQILFDLH
jgi:hypothetical protein